MSTVKNVLFIMADQLRADYLSSYGQRRLATPNIDRIASMGVRYTRAYTSSPVCGPARMSLYTGRTTFSHGATWNFVPLEAGTWTLGDYLRPHGVRVALAGKTHMRPDAEGMARMGVDPRSSLGVLAAECGFEPYERDDGEHPNLNFNPDLAYNRWLREKGYASPNPWNDFANSGQAPDGTVLSGWALRNAGQAARVAEEHSETPYMTNRAIDFMREAGESPWVLHLSYIKPHWPYIAPRPYAGMFGREDVAPAVRHERERSGHPVYAAFQDMQIGRTFSRDETRETVIPTYMGLIKQIDDHLGRVLAYLETSGRMQDTMIIFTSDHGDYLGDHWLGEKELFHEPSSRVPLIVYDPDARANATRGSSDARFVEGIDILPTIVEAMGVELPAQRVEGQSLLRGIRSAGETVAGPWREAAFSEIDYGMYKARLSLGVAPAKARAYMIRTDRWKYVWYKGFRPQLFDLHNDPQELEDLGASQAHGNVLSEHQGLLLERLTDRRNRVTVSDATIEANTDGARKKGVLIGEW
ncbi:MAG: sulfatase-like hydrolase/transferase [Burkholderiales bacterium]